MKINKHGEVSETITWIIASVIIIVVLIISFLIARGGSESDWTFSDKQKDFIATKSIITFVELNSELIQNITTKENYSEFDKIFNPFLQTLYVNYCKNYCSYDGAWGITLKYAGDMFVKHTLIINPLAEPKEYYGLSLFFPVDDKKIEIKFSKQSGGINT